MLNLNGANKKIDGLRVDQDQDADEALAIWKKLIVWFAYAKDFETETEALKNLSPGDDLWEIHQSLMWSWRYFVGYFPEEIKKGNWVEVGKLSFELYIVGAIEYDVLTPEELSEKEYLENCIEFTTANIIEYSE